MINILPNLIIGFTKNTQGTYILFIKIRKEIFVKIRGKETKLEPGYYFYVGSAFGAGGLTSRLHRHLRKNKKKHWHIDQVTMSNWTEIEGIAVSLKQKNECLIASIFSEIEDLIPIIGFGNSDCFSCQSHFFKLNLP